MLKIEAVGPDQPPRTLDQKFKRRSGKQLGPFGACEKRRHMVADVAWKDKHVSGMIFGVIRPLPRACGDFGLTWDEFAISRCSISPTMEWADDLVIRHGAFRKVCTYMPASGIHGHRSSGRQTEANELLAE
jgi:hypothetical protein